MNPAMSSWLALRLRAPLRPGQSVFVLGATGNAGQMAIQIAKRLGAGRVVGAGRELRRLEKSGADELVSLVGDAKSVSAAVANAGPNATSCSTTFGVSPHSTHYSRGRFADANGTAS